MNISFVMRCNVLRHYPSTPKAFLRQFLPLWRKLISSAGMLSKKDDGVCPARRVLVHVNPKAHNSGATHRRIASGRTERRELGEGPIHGRDATSVWIASHTVATTTRTKRMMRTKGRVASGGFAVRAAAGSAGRGAGSPAGRRPTRQQTLHNTLARVAAQEGPITGTMMDSFAPIDQASGELAHIANASITESCARKMYAPECEAAVNRQINIEYSISYLYHAMYAFFARDNVGLPGFSEYFKKESEEEREHAEKLMEYQTLRGGRVVLGSLMSPITEFDHADKGEALYAMELALSLERLNYEKLLELHAVGDKNGDPQLCDFVESQYLEEQLEAIKKLAVFVSQLRRVGKGHGVYHFDLQLQN